MPFDERKASTGQGVVSAFLKDWQVNGVFSGVTGRPFTVFASTVSLNAPLNAETADQPKPEVKKLGGVGPGQP